MTFLQFEHVTRRFDNGQEGLSDVSLGIEQGSMVFLTGHSGAGKSTLLKLLIGLDTPTSGRVMVDGCDLKMLSAKQIPWYRRQIGIVLQDHNLLQDRTVFENVALPLRLSPISAKDIARRVRGALATVDLSDKGGLLPRHLSTGEQQRVGIARAVVTRPRIILADEPTGNLDPFLSRQVMALFHQFRDLGTTVLVASHDIDLIKDQGCRILHLSQGALVQDTAQADHGEAE
jgi:cell division transport system ATP-binding protein